MLPAFDFALGGRNNFGFRAGFLQRFPRFSQFDLFKSIGDQNRHPFSIQVLVHNAPFVGRARRAEDSPPYLQISFTPTPSPCPPKSSSRSSFASAGHARATSRISP